MRPPHCFDGPPWLRSPPPAPGVRTFRHGSRVIPVTGAGKASFGRLPWEYECHDIRDFWWDAIYTLLPDQKPHDGEREYEDELKRDFYDVVIECAAGETSQLTHRWIDDMMRGNRRVRQLMDSNNLSPDSSDREHGG
jgi:hypothetical protein